MVARKNKTAYSIGAIAAVAAVIASMILLQPITAAAKPNQITGTMKLVDENGKEFKSIGGPFSFTLNGRDVTSARLVTAFTGSFTTEGSEVPVKNWTLSGIARLKVGQQDAIVLNLKLTGNSPSISNAPLPLRDTRCSTPSFAQIQPCDFSMTSYSRSVWELTYGTGKLAYTYSGPVEIRLLLTQAKLTVNFENGKQIELFAVGGAGSAPPSITIGTFNLEAIAEQQPEPKLVVSGFGVGVASGTIELQEP